MHPATPNLIELQRVDHEIASLRTQVDGFPKLIRDLDVKLGSARAAVASAKELHTNHLKERKKFELDVEQWKDRARKYRDQSGAVKTNEAYKALLHEIANAEAETAKAEDRQLDIMMNVESAERLVRKAEADLKEAEQALGHERKQVEQQQAEKKKLLGEVVAVREKVVVTVPEDIRELYTRIAKRHNGTGLAEARNNQCRGCGMRVLPHILQELTQDANQELFRCESCGLILYSLEPIAEAKPAATTTAAIS